MGIEFLQGLAIALGFILGLGSAIATAWRLWLHELAKRTFAHARGAVETYTAAAELVQAQLGPNGGGLVERTGRMERSLAEHREELAGFRRDVCQRFSSGAERMDRIEAALIEQAPGRAAAPPSPPSAPGAGDIPEDMRWLFTRGERASRKHEEEP